MRDIYKTEWYEEQAAIAERQNRAHLAKHDRSFNAVMAEAEAVAKAHRDRGAGPHGLTGALLEHLHDRLERRREQHGFEKSAKDHSIMDNRTTELRDIAKSGGLTAFGKNHADNPRGVTEHEYTDAITYAAHDRHSDLSPYQAFDKVFAAPGEEGVWLRKGHAAVKAAEFSVEPRVFGREAMNPNQPTDMLAAYNDILQAIRERFPYRTGAQQLAMADEELARQHHVHPQANYANVYAMPLETVEKRDDGSTGGAYDELMLKAEAYRNVHPECSIAQAFSKVYSSRDNIELAKRERAEAR